MKGLHDRHTGILDGIIGPLQNFRYTKNIPFTANQTSERLTKRFYMWMIFRSRAFQQNEGFPHIQKIRRPFICDIEEHPRLVYLSDVWLVHFRMCYSKMWTKVRQLNRRQCAVFEKCSYFVGLVTVLEAILYCFFIFKSFIKYFFVKLHWGLKPISAQLLYFWKKCNSSKLLEI